LPFIAPIIAAKGEFGLPAVLGGVVAAGLVYVLLGFAVRIKGAGFIDRLLPPVVIDPGDHLDRPRAVAGGRQHGHG